MKVGDRIKVTKSIFVYHNPEHRGQQFELQNQEGEITALANEWHGKPISANFPYIVQFTKKFRAHLREDEIQVI